jgi:hypothetical protein
MRNDDVYFFDVDADTITDVDLLVVEHGLSDKRSETVRLRNMVRPLRIPVDIIVVSEEEFRDPVDRDRARDVPGGP